MPFVMALSQSKGVFFYTLNKSTLCLVVALDWFSNGQF